ncbi:MAG: GTPase HflX [Candidatus Omnitrophota bacterium]
MEKALLVTIKLYSEKEAWNLEDAAQELEQLVESTGVEIVDNITAMCEKPSPKFLVGSGKAEEIALLAQEQECDVVIFSHDLSGTQQKNLEEAIGKKTIDRTQLILDIFARHAKSPEGKMQVELAQLQYVLPRLIGKGIILSRLGGGIGTSGPGEQKLELDRRRIRKRIDRLRDDIKQYMSHRQVMRKKRKDSAMPLVALVGYTSAGKSTLLNTLTGADQAVAQTLFTTLDPLHKSLQLPNGENIVLSDTVGFLHNLPHGLIEAFKATLEEVTEADLLVHVLDAAHPRVLEHKEAVLEVLKELKAQDKPMVTALNKVDLVEDAMWLERLKEDMENPVVISAKFNKNLEALLETVQKNFVSRMISAEIMLKHSRMDLVDLFYREGKVEKIDYLQEGIKIKLYIPRLLYERLVAAKEIIVKKT